MTSFRSIGLGTGVILAILGLALFIFPVSSMWLFAVLVGCGILIMGLNAVFTWYKTMRGTGMGTGVLVTGVLSIIFAILCLFSPLAFAEVITWLIAIAVIVFGIAQICSLVATPDISGRLIGILGSVIVVLFGIFALIWPQLIMQFIGISLFIEGLTAVIMALTAPRM